MIEKITIEELIEEIYADQLDIIRESEISAKERNEQKENIKKNILECESLEELFDGLKKIGYPQAEVNDYILSFFIDS